MNRKIKLGYVFLSLAVAATLSSCSSDKKTDEGVSPDVAEATSDASAPAPEGGAAPTTDAAAAPAPDANGAPPPGDQAAAAAPADPNAPPAPGEPGKAPETTEGEMAAADAASGAPPAPGAPGAPGDSAAPPAPGDQASAAPPPTDAAAAPAPDTSAAPPPSTDTAAADTGASGQSGDLFGAGGTSGADAGADTPPPAPKKSSAVVHIKDAPFSRGGQNLNTVYIAREGDTLDSISQKLFGADHTKELKKGNPSLKKGVKTGDKVYFNSPNRPDDKEKMLTVYEDQGLEPSRYTTKEGDSLKALAQEWYGSESSWKEIYAVNKSLASTKELPAGTELTYWPATAAVAVYGAKKEADVAQNGNVPAPPPGGNAPPPDMNNVPQPPPTQANNAPPPGGAPGTAPGTVDNSAANLPPPPPPPDMNAAPPPPPPITTAKKHPRDTASPLAGMDKDTIMYGAAAGVFLIGGGLLVAIRRRNARRNSGITQV